MRPLAMWSRSPPPLPASSRRAPRAHGLAHAQLEHAGGVAELALARDDDQVGAVDVGDARRVRRERVPVAAPACPLETSAPPPAARTSSAQA